MTEITELIVDAYGCESNLSDLKSIEKAARLAVQGVGAKIAKATSHCFQPHGLTLCLILKESHLIVSTWPEYHLAIVNIFLCNAKMDARKCWAPIAQILKPRHTVFHSVVHKLQAGQKAA